MRPTLAVLALAASLAGGASAQPLEDVDIELVLLADATGSIDDDEIRFQRRGYAEAMAEPDVVAAMTGGPLGRVAVAYVEFGDFASQDVVVNWSVIAGPEDVARFSEVLLAAPRRARGRNAIGAALLKGVEMIETGEHHGLRRVIDLSADSANNWNGPGIEEGRRAALDAGITINGLAVLCRDCASGRAGGPELERLFEERIVAGPGAFVVTADGSRAFAEAIERKLLRELQLSQGGAGSLQAPPGAAR